jgi:hypothetical protein
VYLRKLTSDPGNSGLGFFHIVSIAKTVLLVYLCRGAATQPGSCSEGHQRHQHQAVVSVVPSDRLRFATINPKVRTRAIPMW